MLIELHDVSFTYMPGTSLAQTALTDISLMITEGEFIGIAGSTGSGKSTLIQHLNGLLSPTRGSIRFKGREIDKESLQAMRTEVGLVFQFPESQLFEETVEDDVAFGPKNLGVPDVEVQKRVEESLRMVGLDYDSFAGRSPFSLSGGEKRLVAMAGILAMKPRALVLDEPTSGLDAGGKARVLACIDELNKNGTTIILVTHDMDDIAEYARRLIVLREGRVVIDGGPLETFAQAALLRDAGLDIPTTVEVLARLKERGLAVSSSSLTTEDTVSAILAAVREKQCL